MCTFHPSAALFGSKTPHNGWRAQQSVVIMRRPRFSCTLHHYGVSCVASLLCGQSQRRVDLDRRHSVLSSCQRAALRPLRSLYQLGAHAEKLRERELLTVRDAP